ncbi:hypothetical protein LTR02_000092 [Friedmanniomyces endolithicus]|nr:hypothetical protein LTR94_001167 [Friedmanniomyces endolithicus]KAK0816499.1 hypothetical protein LTR59_000127 [Friedmanniomyces endolithicus]KAK0816629.1 hypothetical protein LTR38_002018 [Friedmanniomyces endolithicus]KAK0820895.1 hypothetical protein LTR75_001214 [Friedmanniomyces endolithicus]KAK0853346.1 hypothetical protein LTR03_002907 [Friedmanniomyces endolithicus]
MHYTLPCLAALAGVCSAQSSFSPLRPPALPLAVRSPYMNTWQQAGSDGGNGGYLAGEWPSFWMGQLTGWTGFVRVDNVTYNWLGGSNQSALYVEQTKYEYTATKSIFTMNAGGLVDMVVTFLSPVIPDDLLRASLPYTYLSVDVVSADGAQHEVQLYTHISAEWVWHLCIWGPQRDCSVELWNDYAERHARISQCGVFGGVFSIYGGFSIFGRFSVFARLCFVRIFALFSFFGVIECYRVLHYPVSSISAYILFDSHSMPAIDPPLTCLPALLSRISLTARAQLTN